MKSLGQANSGFPPPKKAPMGAGASKKEIEAKNAEDVARGVKYGSWLQRMEENFGNILDRAGLHKEEKEAFYELVLTSGEQVLRELHEMKYTTMGLGDNDTVSFGSVIRLLSEKRNLSSETIQSLDKLAEYLDGDSDMFVDKDFFLPLYYDHEPSELMGKPIAKELAAEKVVDIQGYKKAKDKEARKGSVGQAIEKNKSASDAVLAEKSERKKLDKEKAKQDQQNIFKQASGQN
jgi:hypothetical protein